MSRKLNAAEMAAGSYKFFRFMTGKGLLNINLEVTKRCNARCNFCDYWKEDPPEELKDYVPVVRKLNPLSVSLTGGEPFLRKDLPEIISSLRRSFGFLFISLITNGLLLDLDRGLEVWEAGLDELSISLDYFDQRHDLERGLPGLTERILSVAPRLASAGVNLCFNVVVKRGNYREMPEMLKKAARMGVKVSLSSYNCWRTDNETHMIPEDELSSLRGAIAAAKKIKRETGVVTTGEYYLERVPEFFENRGISGCTAGVNWVQVTPDGMIKRCSDHPVSISYEKWRKGHFAPTGCDRCWYSCRGAAQEPWSVGRFVEMAKDALT